MNSEEVPLSKWFVLTGLKGNPLLAPFMWPPFNFLLIGAIPGAILLVLMSVNIIPFQGAEYALLLCLTIIIFPIFQMVPNRIFANRFRFSLDDEGIIVNLTIQNFQKTIYGKSAWQESQKFPWNELQSVEITRSLSEKCFNISSVIIYRKIPPGSKPQWLAFLARPYIGAQEDRIILPALRKQDAERMRDFAQQKISI